MYGEIEDQGGRIQDETVKDYLALSTVTAAQHCRTGLEVLYEGSLAVSFETNLSLAGVVGLETTLTGQFEFFVEVARRVYNGTRPDVLSVANAYLDTERYALAMVGPLDGGSLS